MNSKAEFSPIASYKIIATMQDRHLVKSLYANGREVLSFFKIRTMDDICATIQAGAPLHLDGCYINEFSYEIIQKRCGSDTVLRGFSARGAFFDGFTDFFDARFEAGEKNFCYARFRGDFSFAKAQFDEGDVSFLGIHTSNGFIFDSANFRMGRVSFREASFGQGNVSFRSTEFGVVDVDFNFAQFRGGNVSFYDARLGTGCVSFHKVCFGDGDVVFKATRFGTGNVDFSFANFGTGNVDFGHTQFNKGDINFHHAQFSAGKIDFNSASFNDCRVYFNDTHFANANVSFTHTRFGNGRVCWGVMQFSKCTISFQSVDHKDLIYDFIDNQTFLDQFIAKSREPLYNTENNVIYIFHSITFDRELDLSRMYKEDTSIRFENCRFLHHDNLRVGALYRLEIIDCILERSILLNDTREERVSIHQLSFENSKNQGIIYIDWDTARKGIHAHGKETIQAINDCAQAQTEKCQSIKSIYKQQAKQFQILKENFHNLGEYDHEDEAFVEFMRSDRKTRHWFSCFSLWVLDKIGAYGTRPWRLFYWMLGIVFVFTLIFNALYFWDTHYGLDGVSMQILGMDFSFKSKFFEITGKYYCWPDYTIGLYISIISFLTIGDSQVSPTQEFSSLLVSAEAFIGIFLMSYFIVSLVRKTLR